MSDRVLTGEPAFRDDEGQAASESLGSPDFGFDGLPPLFFDDGEGDGCPDIIVY